MRIICTKEIAFGFRWFLFSLISTVLKCSAQKKYILLTSSPTPGYAFRQRYMSFERECFALSKCVLFYLFMLIFVNF